eukprot:8276053-Prorocentrum_lima.AAC.1
MAQHNNSRRCRSCETLFHAAMDNTHVTRVSSRRLYAISQKIARASQMPSKPAQHARERNEYAH